MVYDPVNHIGTTGGMEPRAKFLLRLCATMTRKLLPNAWATPARRLWQTIAERAWLHEKCSVKHDVEKSVVAS